MIRIAAAALGLAVMADAWAASASVRDLVLERSYFVEGPVRFQPSGLTLCNGELWTVSDKHGATVFRLDLQGEIARAYSVASEKAGGVADAVGDFDAEGVACMGDDIFIASETTSRIYKLTRGSERLTPVTPNLATELGETGLFARNNAGIEAFVALDSHTLVIAAEREPRGIVEIDTAVTPPRVTGQVMESSRYPGRPGIPLDFAGLAVWQGRLFVLARNQGLVVELVRRPDGGWEEGPAWAYASVENRPDLRYQDRRFGRGEGLAIDDSFFYVILDNNDDARESAPEDFRPQLFVFKNPISTD